MSCKQKHAHLLAQTMRPAAVIFWSAVWAVKLYFLGHTINWADIWGSSSKNCYLLKLIQTKFVNSFTISVIMPMTSCIDLPSITFLFRTCGPIKRHISLRILTWWHFSISFCYKRPGLCRLWDNHDKAYKCSLSYRASPLLSTSRYATFTRVSHTLTQTNTLRHNARYGPWFVGQMLTWRSLSRAQSAL